MRQYKKSTIKEVAAEAGVSTTTVSIFVSGRENVCSAETAERIRSAITALNYTPNSLAAGLHRRTTSTIGVSIMSLADMSLADMSLPEDPRSSSFLYIARLERGIALQADEEGLALLHYPRAIRFGEGIEPFLDGRVDGLLFHSLDNSRPEWLAAAGMPTVMLARSRNLPKDCGTACADETQTAALALSHLWDLGHRRIAHFAGPVGVFPALGEVEDDTAVGRLEGYAAWLKDRGAFDPVLIEYTGSWAVPNARAALERWRRLPQPPTAIFCANDAQALDVLSAAQAMNRRVPQDISLVGVDDSIPARRSQPPLTSVHVPLEDIGREALRSLLRLMAGAKLEECRVTSPVTQIVVRATTRPPAIT